MTTAHDLLVEPLLSWRDRARRRARTTLPGVLARLASGEVEDFPRVRTHQIDPWCMFLTQLAAIALQCANQSDPHVSEDDWREMLLALTNGDHDPWSLVVDDLSKPAFFQPPVPEGNVRSWSESECPDDLDVLVTSKAHEVKPALIHPDEPELWTYAVCTLQTTQGYPGRGYNGVARMNGGYGNRPCIGLAPDHSLSARFVRDVRVLLDSWPALLERGYKEGGVALVWTVPWDGKASLAMQELTPHFIEVCWRVRLRSEGARLSCLYTTTQARRCLPEIETGDVGDPWIPVERGTGKALTVGRRGLHYRLITRLLLQADFEPGAAQEVRALDGDPVIFLGSALARGPGKTEGLHQRALILSGKVRRMIGEADGRNVLGKRAAVQITRAADIQKQVLSPALKKLAGPGKPMRHDLDARIDEIFFSHLFDTLDLADEDAQVAFEKHLADLARRELQRAIDRAPGSDVRKLKAISDAERMFRFCLRKHFRDAAAVQAPSEGAAA